MSIRQRLRSLGRHLLSGDMRERIERRAQDVIADLTRVTNDGSYVAYQEMQKTTLAGNAATEEGGPHPDPPEGE